MRRWFTVALLLVAAPAFGQAKVTPLLTPAEAAAILAPHQYVAPPVCTRCDGPYIASTGAKGPTAGPWDWPTPAPLRRLDGTLLDYPPTVYGAYRCPFTYPVPRVAVAHRVHQDRRR